MLDRREEVQRRRLGSGDGEWRREVRREEQRESAVRAAGQLRQGPVSVKGQYDKRQGPMLAPSVFVKQLMGSKTGEPTRRARADETGEAGGVEAELEGPEKRRSNSFHGMNQGKGLKQSEILALGVHDDGMVRSKNSNATEKRLKK